jgi:single-strand DNA-binding protein
MNINKVIIAGNVTRDPELRSLPTGSKVASFSVATNRVWNNPQGVRQEASDFHSVVVFARLAEVTAQYVKKGTPVFVEGRLQTRSWDGQDGKKQYRTEIVAEKVQFGRPNPTRPQQPGGVYRKEGDTVPPMDQDHGQDNVPDIEEIAYPEGELNPEDIPF